MSSPSETSDDNATDDTSSDENAGADVGVGDDQLPEDLVPGEDNPLAEGLEDGETVDDLMESGKPARESEDESDDGDSED